MSDKPVALTAKRNDLGLTEVCTYLLAHPETTFMLAVASPDHAFHFGVWVSIYEVDIPLGRVKYREALGLRKGGMSFSISQAVPPDRMFVLPVAFEEAKPTKGTG